jgi:hypothetical protein
MDARPANQDFHPDELLYRRVPNTHVEDGEVSLLAISGELKFEEDPKSTSTVRGAYSAPLDCLHSDCANGEDVSRTHWALACR